VKFEPLALPGAWRVIPQRAEDPRGWFVRTYDEVAFREHDLPTRWPQHNASGNDRRGTLRGLHGVRRGYREDKLIRCVRGRVWDVLVDLRPESATYLQSHVAELSAANGEMLYAPTGVFHGFQTLVDDSEVFYLMSEPYVPEAAAGVAWDDPKLGIAWPVPNPILSERDRGLPRL
jgi:dTDP-4-dehydrorhamnose 3,5-epimerase